MKRTSVLCFVALVAASGVARADDEKSAAAHFREGRRAFDAGDCVLAATEFEAANRAKPAAAALLSAGLAWECNGDALAAANDLDAALAMGGLEARDEATARKHLADVDAKLGRVEIVGPEGARATLDGGDEERSLPARVRLRPGDHTIDARLDDGTRAHRLVHVAAGESQLVDLTPAPVTAPPPSAPFPVQRTLGWVSVGVGASAFVIGAIVGGVGLGVRDTYVSGGAVDASQHDQAVAMRTAANVLWVSAAVFLAAGVGLVVTAPKRAAPSVAIHPTGATLRWTF